MEQRAARRHYTPAEYFALEEQSEVRHEYYDGEVFAMAGGTKSHNLIAQSITLGLRAGLRGSGCQVFMKDVRLAVQDEFHHTYPDVVVSCDPADRRDPYLVRQPVLIVEVLSPSTGEYDRGRKFNQYKQLLSLRHYLLVSQTAWVLEWFRRNEADEWVYTVLSDPADVLEIADLSLHLPLPEVYDDTDVAPLLLAPAPEAR